MDTLKISTTVTPSGSSENFLTPLQTSNSFVPQTPIQLQQESHHNHNHGHTHSHSHSGHDHPHHDHSHHDHSHHDHSHSHHDHDHSHCDHDHDHSHSHSHLHSHHPPPPGTKIPSIPFLISYLLSHNKSLVLWTLTHACITIAIFTYGLMWDSLALAAYSYLLLFDFFGLVNQLVSLILKWKIITPSKLYCYGVQRFEVLFAFTNALSLWFSGMYAIKESFEHLSQPETHEEHLESFSPLAPLLALAITLIGMLTFQNHKDAVILLQQSKNTIPAYALPHSNTSFSLSNIVKLIQVNPYAQGSVFCCAAVLSVKLVEIWSKYKSPATLIRTIPYLDPLSAFVQGIAMIVLAVPISKETGKILLQAMPRWWMGVVEKALRELTTLPSVLEIRTPHFWTLSYNRYISTITVRIKSDADETWIRELIQKKLKEVGVLDGGYDVGGYGGKGSAKWEVDWKIEVVKDSWI
ncbi:cation efflux family-domain-containing protein [Paraphysoderma sedebokerense]|nr:cation efflux family-domain-containing protein [Paraphysoderma sedebokerense]